MKISKTFDVISSGAFPSSPAWNRAAGEVEAAISAVDWPHGSGQFRLNPEPALGKNGKLERHSNGVTPIKIPILGHLVACGWEVESLPPLPPETLLTTGDLDALRLDGDSYVAFEWETGNVSSSHRAISKILDALCRGVIAGGFLVLPVKATQRYLTDRIGNYEEIEPYFSFWARYPVADGALRIYGVEHDVLDESVPHIPKGRDGRALV
jgi:hypothetical protein